MKAYLSVPLLCVLLPCAVQAGVVIDQSNLADARNGELVASAAAFAGAPPLFGTNQTVTAGRFGYLAGVDLQLWGFPTTSAFRVSLYDGDGSLPGARLLGAFDYPGSALPTSGDGLFRVDTRSLNYLLRPNQQFSVNVNRIAGTGGPGWVIGNGVFNQNGDLIDTVLLNYAGGEAKIWNPVTSTYDPRAADRAFRTHVEAVTSSRAIASAQIDGRAWVDEGESPGVLEFENGSRVSVNTFIGTNRIFAQMNSQQPDADQHVTSLWSDQLRARSLGDDPVRIQAQVHVAGSTSDQLVGNGEDERELNFYLWAFKGDIAGFGNEDGFYDDPTLFFHGDATPFSIEDLSAENRADPRVLDVVSLCSRNCGPGSYDRRLRLDFTVAPGERFYLVGALMVEGVYRGRVAFQNSAILEFIEVSDGGSLESESGLLELVDGAYRYRAPPAPVPEPATWLTLVAGFGLAGAGLRARTARLA